MAKKPRVPQTHPIIRCCCVRERLATDLTGISLTDCYDGYSSVLASVRSWYYSFAFVSRLSLTVWQLPMQLGLIVSIHPSKHWRVSLVIGSTSFGSSWFAPYRINAASMIDTCIWYCCTFQFFYVDQVGRNCIAMESQQAIWVVFQKLWLGLALWPKKAGSDKDNQLQIDPNSHSITFVQFEWVFSEQLSEVK